MDCLSQVEREGQEEEFVLRVELCVSSCHTPNTLRKIGKTGAGIFEEKVDFRAWGKSLKRFLWMVSRSLLKRESWVQTPI